MRALLALLSVIALAATAVPAPAAAETPVAFTLSGYVTGVDRVWMSFEDGVPVAHFRGTVIAAVVSGDLEGTATVSSASDIDLTTGSGNHRGELTIVTAGGSLTGRFEGRTTMLAHLEGSWTATRGTGDLTGVQVRADYAGDFYLAGALEFAGTMR